MIDWIERNRGHILVTLINLAALGAVVCWLRQPPSTPVKVVVPATAPTAAVVATTTPTSVRLYVTGAVHNPDVYNLPEGSLVKDAVAAAGGALEKADLNHVNLAHVVLDQEQLYVPFVGDIDEPPPVESGGRSSGMVVEVDGCININTATTDDLETLPGIGPELAERIVSYRASHGVFGAPDEIMDVPGIGDATFERIRDQIVSE